MKKPKIITKRELNDLLEQEYRSNREYMNWKMEAEIDGLLHSIYEDKRSGELYAVRVVRTVHMGFNSNEEGKVEELVGIIEREGACNASWGVTGRTMHEILAHRLSKELPQYDFDIGHNYRCLVTKKAG